LEPPASLPHAGRLGRLQHAAVLPLPISSPVSPHPEPATGMAARRAVMVAAGLSSSCSRHTLQQAGGLPSATGVEVDGVTDAAAAAPAGARASAGDGGGASSLLRTFPLPLLTAAARHWVGLRSEARTPKSGA
jgi:hypothetical protein